MSRLVLNGIVSGDDDLVIYSWFGLTAFSPKMLREAVAATEQDDVLTLEVNSPGGSVMAGMEMYSLLADAPVLTRAIVQSYAASAASFLILGAAEALATPGAQLMLHRPSVSTEGNVDDHLESVQMLRSTEEALLNVYERRCKGKLTREELSAVMEAETWIPADRAVEMGLLDGIYDPKAQADPRNLAAAFGLPDIAVLRAKYAEAHKGNPADGAPPAEDPDAWKARARLDIETNRYKF